MVRPLRFFGSKNEAKGRQMTSLMTETGKFIAIVSLLVGLCLSGCGGGGAASGASPTGNGTPVSKNLSWSPPSAYQDNSPLDPNHDLAGYNIYIKSVSAGFSDNDVESAFMAPADTSVDLIPVCSLLALPAGTYHVSIRAIAKNGLMSDFSPSATFTL